jgi:hypothetical protein
METQQFSDEQLNIALELTHQEYFMQVLGIMSHSNTVEELNYVKIPIITPGGGTYLISILHVDGPKINLQSLAKLDQTKKENI